MAEQTVAARIVVEIACAAGLPLSLAPAATAKIVTSTAAPSIAATAHAVHGAIGISAEHDLHLYTRRLLAWRMEHGSEGWWEARLGTERLAANVGRSEEHTSELQSLMRISYAVVCLKQKNKKHQPIK